MRSKVGIQKWIKTMELIYLWLRNLYVYFWEKEGLGEED